MGFETPLTIQDAISRIYRRQYLLPAIQREFVWSKDQIELLFDSLLRGYPIGSFLFWAVPREQVHEYQYYEFVRNYHELNHRHNEKADVKGEEGITAVLDGQQRLSALYIGLKGSYAEKLKYKARHLKENYPETKLYLNILKAASQSDGSVTGSTEKLYDFRFLTKHPASAGTHWFEVGKVLDWKDLTAVLNYVSENGFAQLDTVCEAVRD